MLHLCPLQYDPLKNLNHDFFPQFLLPNNLAGQSYQIGIITLY